MKTPPDTKYLITDLKSARKNTLKKSYFKTRIFKKNLLVIFRQYKSCQDLHFCMDIHDHIVHHYCKNCISSF